MILTSSDDENKHANKSEKQSTVKFWKVFFNTIYILSFIVVCAILISEFLLPVVRIYDDSMNSTLKKDDIVVLYKTKSINNGVLAAFFVVVFFVFVVAILVFLSIYKKYIYLRLFV